MTHQPHMRPLRRLGRLRWRPVSPWWHFGYQQQRLRWLQRRWRGAVARQGRRWRGGEHWDLSTCPEQLARGKLSQWRRRHPAVAVADHYRDSCTPPALAAPRPPPLARPLPPPPPRPPPRPPPPRERARPQMEKPRGIVCAPPPSATASSAPPPSPTPSPSLDQSRHQSRRRRRRRRCRRVPMHSAPPPSRSTTKRAPLPPRPLPPRPLPRPLAPVAPGVCPARAPTLPAPTFHLPIALSALRRAQQLRRCVERLPRRARTLARPPKGRVGD